MKVQYTKKYGLVASRQIIKSAKISSLHITSMAIWYRNTTVEPAPSVTWITHHLLLMTTSRSTSPLLYSWQELNLVVEFLVVITTIGGLDCIFKVALSTYFSNPRNVSTLHFCQPCIFLQQIHVNSFTESDQLVKKLMAQQETSSCKCYVITLSKMSCSLQVWIPRMLPAACQHWLLSNLVAVWLR